MSLKELESILTKEIFIKLYINENKRLSEIAELYNVNKRMVERLRSKYDIRLPKELSIKRYEETNLKKYGVTHPAQSKEIIVKMEKTNMEKYGHICTLHNKEIQEKVKQTNLNKYGVEQVLRNKEIYKKTKETLKSRYGTYAPLYNNEIIHQAQEKIKKTNLEKYGVEWACLSKECLAGLDKTDSKPNVSFANLLDKYNICYEREYTIVNKSYDFKVNNILIEINPSATHNSTWGLYNKSGIDKKYHYEKTQLASQYNFRCVHVFDWDDINKILNILKPKSQIYARKCIIKEITDKKIIKSFLNTNHLQGYCKGTSICVGLYYKNELVEIMTFGKPRYNKNYEYELLRFCTHSDYVIIGGAEKIFKYFINTYKPDSILSYCDNSKFSGDVYKQLGFVKLSDGVLSRHWYNIKTKQHITDNFLRQRGFDQLFNKDYGKGTSNDQLMIEHGFVEIYDCGQSVWVYNKNNDQNN